MSEKTVKFYIRKLNWDNHNTMPFMQGEAIKAVIKEHNIPAKRWGWYADVVGVETNKQIMLWKDDGVRLTFLGMQDKESGKIHLPKKKPEVKKVVFNTLKELYKEEGKRDYENIKGLKAKVTEKEYDYALNVLPPLCWKGNTFYMSEFLSGNLTHKYSIVGKQHYCEIADFKENHPKMEEEQYLQMRY